jgi:hypothetical protein
MRPIGKLSQHSLSITVAQAPFNETPLRSQSHLMYHHLMSNIMPSDEGDYS